MNTTDTQVLDALNAWTIAHEPNNLGGTLDDYAPETATAMRAALEATKLPGVVSTLSDIIRWMNEDIVAVTRSEDLITADHDGDYQAIWERAHDLYPRIDQLTTDRDRLRDGIKEVVDRWPSINDPAHMYDHLLPKLRALLDGEASHVD